MRIRFAFLLILTLPPVSNAGTTDPSKLPQLWCEFLLQDPIQIEDAMDDLNDALTRTEHRKTIRQAGPIRPPALNAFGLTRFSQINQLELRTMKNDSNSATVGQFDLILKMGETERLLDREILPYPPIFAWQPIRMNEATYGLVPEKIDAIPTGVIISESDYGRKFFSVEDLPDSRFLITIGIDVPCEQLEKFSSTNAKVGIRTEHGWLCRIPVLTTVTTIRLY
jgi:hypothetical protein